MTITRVGTNEKYASGWDTIFGGKKKSATKPSSTIGVGAAKTKTNKAVKKAAKTVAPKPVAKKAAKKAANPSAAKKASSKKAR